MLQLKSLTAYQQNIFVDQYKSIPEYKIYGMNRYQYQYIASHYKDEVNGIKTILKYLH